MVLIDHFSSGLFATQPNNCTIFPMYLSLSLCFLFWSSAYWQTQAEEKKNGKSDLRNLSTVCIFIFFQGLLLYEFPSNQMCVHLPPSPS